MTYNQWKRGILLLFARRGIKNEGMRPNVRLESEDIRIVENYFRSAGLTVPADVLQMISDGRHGFPLIARLGSDSLNQIELGLTFSLNDIRSLRDGSIYFHEELDDGAREDEVLPDLRERNVVPLIDIGNGSGILAL